MFSALAQEVLVRLDDGMSLSEVEAFIDGLRVDDERAAALWLLAWLGHRGDSRMLAAPDG